MQLDPETGGSMDQKLGVLWVRLEIGFYSLFLIGQR
jgi:hypothetical protein